MGEPRKKVAGATKRQAKGKTSARRIVAEMVEGIGTDAEIAKRCEALSDWVSFDDATKAEVVRLLRVLQNSEQSPQYEVNVGEGGELSVDPPSGVAPLLTALRLVETMASGSNDLVTQRVGDLSGYHRGGRGRLTTRALSADLAFVRGGHAQDTVQSALLVQMAVTHDSAMQALGRLNGAEYAEQAQLWGNLGAKLLARFTAQAEALAKLQRGGVQEVRHIHIDNRHGGQAIVADTFVKGGSESESRNQSHALPPAMWGENSQGVALPSASDQGSEAVQNAQRTGKGTAGE